MILAILQTLGILFALIVIVCAFLGIYSLGLYRAEQARPRREAESFDAHAETMQRMLGAKGGEE